MTLIVVTIAGMVVRGPSTVRWEVATDIPRGFNSGALIGQYGIGGAEAVYTLQEFGVWNGVRFAIADGDTFTFRPPGPGTRWRIWTEGALSTPPAGLPGWSPLDQNLDGFTDGIDYDRFIAAFEAGDLSADFNADGFVDGMDYDTFQAEWATR